jgi:hypothetical protein
MQKIDFTNKLNYLPLSDVAARVLHKQLDGGSNTSVELGQENDNELKLEPIHYRFFSEKQSIKSHMITTDVMKSFKSPIWYYVCEYLELLHFKNWYNNPNRQFTPDPGAFIAFQQEDVKELSFKKFYDQRKQLLLSPFFVFNKTTHILVIRIQRLQRLNWLNETLGVGWLYRLLNRFYVCTTTSVVANSEKDEKFELDSEETKLQALIQEAQEKAMPSSFLENPNEKPDAKWQQQRKSDLKLAVRSSYVFQIPYGKERKRKQFEGSNKTKCGRICKSILPQLPFGVPRRFVRKFHHVEKFITDQSLLEMYVYMDDQEECVLQQDLDTAALNQETKLLFD